MFVLKSQFARHLAPLFFCQQPINRLYPSCATAAFYLSSANAVFVCVRARVIIRALYCTRADDANTVDSCEHLLFYSAVHIRIEGVMHT